MEFEIEDLNGVTESIPTKKEKKYEYTWEELEKSYPLKTRKALEYFASSDLPNKAFLQVVEVDIVRQFEEKIRINLFKTKINDGWLWPKAYWDACVFILVKRGLPQIANVKKEMLKWWQDPNWPGYLLAHKFVMEHKEEFVTETKESILLALEQKDEIWLYWLLNSLYKDVVPDLAEETVQKIDEVIEFLDSNEIWANLINKYGNFIKQLCL